MSTFNSGKAAIYVFKVGLQAKIRLGRKCPSTALGLPTGGKERQDSRTQPEKVKRTENYGGTRIEEENKATKKKKICVSVFVVTGNGVYVSMNGSGFSDIMLSLPMGNSNYAGAFPVSHQPPLLCILRAKCFLHSACD